MIRRQMKVIGSTRQSERAADMSTLKAIEIRRESGEKERCTEGGAKDVPERAERFGL